MFIIAAYMHSLPQLQMFCCNFVVVCWPQSSPCSHAIIQAHFASAEAIGYEERLSDLEATVRRIISLRAFLSQLQTERVEATKTLAGLKAKQDTKREELRHLASEKARISQKKSVAEEQIAQADLRLPQIEAEKKAAAVNKVYVVSYIIYG